MEGTRGILSLFILAGCVLVSGAQKRVCTQEAVADIVFLVDGSWSIGTENFEQVRQFLYTLVNSFEVDPDHVRIGLVQYSTMPHTEFLLNSFQTKQDVLQYISTLPYRGGGTKTGLGLDFMLQNHFVDQAGSRANEGVPQIAVVITDGQSQDNVEPHALSLKSRGITLYAIGIKDADEDQLREIATEPHDLHVYSVSDFAALQGISQSIVQVLCTTVEEAKRQLTQVVQACRKATKADIVLLVDGSASIGDANFQEVRGFLRTFIEGLEIGEDKVRVGLVQYSDHTQQEFLLADHVDKRSLLDQVDNLSYRSGGPKKNIGEAITSLQTNYFPKTVRSRTQQGVPQIAVVITDGDSVDDVAKPALNLRDNGVIVFAIGVGAANADKQKAIANKPQERFLFSIRNYQELQSQTVGLLQAVCISIQDQTVALAPKFADIFLLVDSSMTQQQFQQVRSLLVKLGNMNVSAEQHRIGLAQFGQTVQEEFSLNKYLTKEETLSAIRRFKIRPNGARHLGRAMKYASANFFNKTLGGRANLGYHQFLVVLTGGDATDSVIAPSRLVKAEGVSIVAVGLGQSSVQQLNSIATAPYVYETANIAPILRNVFEKEEEILLVGDCQAAKLADIVFIVDQSSSISPSDFKLIHTFLIKILKGLAVGLNKVRVGLVLYSEKPTTEFYLNSFEEKNEMLDFISRLHQRGGGTRTGAALKFAKDHIFVKEKGSRRDQNVQQVAVVITDGKSDDNVSTAAAELRRAGITVYSIGVENANQEELTAMASHPPKTHVFNVDSYKKLLSVGKSLRKILCYNLLTSTVSVSALKYSIKKGCKETEEADIFFLIDQSGSITSTDFQDMKKFIIEFVDTLRIGPQHVRVGVVKYESKPKLEFDLTTYNDKKTLEAAVEHIHHDGGGTETGRALSFMKDYFRAAEVSRSARVPQYLIVITDGESTDKVKEPAQVLRDQNVKTYAVGVKAANHTELLQISGAAERTFLVNDFDALKPIKYDIITDICTPDTCKDAVADLLFLIDSSGSIAPQDFLKMKDFMKSLVRKSVIGLNKLHVGVMQFSSIQKLEFPLNQMYDKPSIEQAIDSMQQLGGGTLTGQGISTISKYFDAPFGGRPNQKRFLVVVTDGEAQDQVLRPAEALGAKGVLIYAIGVANANTSQLLEISGKQERVYSVADFDGLKALERTLTLSLCDPEKECTKTEVADIIFLIDRSSSITQDKFRSMQTFMVSLVNKTTVGEKNTRFGVIMYSTEPENAFSLNEYYSKRDIHKQIWNLKTPKGNTLTAKALEYSIQYFDKVHGGRQNSGVTQILMVITDGEAQDRDQLDAPSLALKNKGIDVFGIGVEGASMAELEIMTQHDKSKTFLVNDFKALENLYLNISQLLCKTVIKECRQADLAILIDGSESIDANDFNTMKIFMTQLISSFNISEDGVRVGVAQFSSNPHKEFHLNQYYDKAAMNKSILAIQQLSEGTRIGRGLTFIKSYFEAAAGSRIQSGIPQNLVVITDGESKDEVVEPAKVLKDMNIHIFVIGIGRVHDMQLQQISGSADRTFTVNNFNSLAEIRTKVVDGICGEKTPDDQKSCTIDIAVGFDITRRTSQPKLEYYLQEIVRYMTTQKDLCCLKNETIKAKIGFRVVASDGKMLDEFKFKEYNEDAVKKVLASQMSQATSFNVALLRSFKEMLQSGSNAGVKVLLIFSDGLDDVIEDMEKESEQLKLSGVHALLTVALEGVQNAQQLQMVEFGRGFGYKQPISIGMQSVASTIGQQVHTVAEKTCCNVMCKCIGPEGVRGTRGKPAEKGQPGLPGHPGFPGEEGGAGERGPPGPTGPQGIEGCPGIRGTKGNRGHRGNRGDDGEHGLDGINGEQGVTGLSGGSGEKGDLGNPGIRGNTGDPGTKGQRGLRGDPGEPGTSSLERGPKGQTGNQGLPGDAGEDGVPGIDGVDGNRGVQGRRGPPGRQGPKGEAGTVGLPGNPGPSGSEGKRGGIGEPGPRGTTGLPGQQGSPGSGGGKGSAGRTGKIGRKGEPGDPGVKGSIGPLGPRGMPGLDGRDGYGPLGTKGVKGELGFPGYPGLQGETGLKGTEGGPGLKGNHGRGGNAGEPGSPGEPGDPGFEGHRGPRGSPGVRTMAECELITYIRNNCACSQDCANCPAYPTELVFALDMSDNVDEAAFTRMRSALLALLNDITVAESNCPTGARVAVVAYSSHTEYLIRFQDYRRKKQLLEAVRGISLTKKGNKRNLGAAMRYVAHNVYKRTRRGMRVRKVAVFLSNGPSEDSQAIVTATMELLALNIIPAVISLKDSPDVRKAFQVDETRLSTLLVLPRNQDLQAELRKIKECVICYDPCKPIPEDSLCSYIQEAPQFQEVDMDLALVVDSSKEVQADQFSAVQQLLGKVVEHLAISPQPGQVDRQARVALVQQTATPQGPKAAKVEFGFQKYQDHQAMRQHVFHSLQQQGGSMALGRTLDFTLTELLLKVPRPRKKKVILAVVGGETLVSDRAKLRQISQRAKCQGVALFVVTVGGSYSRGEVEELASPPVEQHLLHLHRAGQEDQEYAQRFIRAFLTVLNRGMNAYPPSSLDLMCGQQVGQGRGDNQQTMVVYSPSEEEEELEDEDQTEFDYLSRPQVTQVDILAGASRGEREGLPSRPEINDPTSLLLTKESEVPDRNSCYLSQDVGSCQNYTVKWYFDTQQSECSRFWFGGCGGNGNRFDTQEACEGLCLRRRL